MPFCTINNFILWHLKHTVKLIPLHVYYFQFKSPSFPLNYSIKKPGKLFYYEKFNSVNELIHLKTCYSQACT